MKEREQEVMKMVRIYSEAAKVIIWIGESDYITQKAMEAIDEMANHRKRDAASDDSVRFLTSNYNKLPGSDWRLRGILHILERKWFGRGWIVQEASVSRHAQVRCGAQSVSLIDLYRAYRYFVYIGGAFLNQEYLDNINGISMSQMAYQKKLDRPLHSLLLRHRRAQTTLQVDKVYALAGLASDWAELNVNIDYAKPWREVYRDVAIAVLKHSGTLDILSGPRPPTHDPRSKDLPSWVPNWTFRDQMKSLLGHEMSVSHMYPNCAGGSDPPSISFSETLHHLILSGATIGTITEVGQTMPPFNVASRSRSVSEVFRTYGLIQQPTDPS
ncbi:het-domain-containing protein [Fusarium phyllophilum]|uniref:Het-domain-containing protein n=1 Tax=Fusarium phyllophilum TaxID=47803 RepID=A0A8H5MYC7_9HYPO|nr:het-domain-containing protein [Fusarium phyllophilum]